MTEDQDTQKQTDRDILVDARAELRNVKDNVARIETAMDVRFERIETSFETRFQRMDSRIDKIQGEVQTMRDIQNRAAGGLGFGKWVIASLGALPLLVGILAYVAGRGGP